MEIYLTQEKKKEFEQRLLWLISLQIKSEEMWGRIFMLQEILSQAMVLPVEDSWDMAVDRETILNISYPNGVIIKKN